jgi:hypothetical protein
VLERTQKPMLGRARSQGSGLDLQGHQARCALPGGAQAAAPSLILFVGKPPNCFSAATS